MADEPKKPFSQIVAENLIAQLKAGTAPWQRPWKPGDPAAFLPMNPTTGKRYKGINAVHLMSQFRSDPRWMTYKQASAIGAQVRKGEKSTLIQYWKFTDERVKRDDAGKPYIDKDGNTVKEVYELERPRVFFGYVFNGEQIDGLPPLEAKQVDQDWEVIERAERILDAAGAHTIHVHGDRAFYRPSADQITMPERSQFPTATAYYATRFHELGHWTGHHTRLDRDLGHPFGSEGYAKEELRAEIASMILGVELGLGHDPGQHAAYVKSWIKVIEDDHMEIFRAAADAEKIQDYVLAFEQKQIQEIATAMAVEKVAQREPTQSEVPDEQRWIVKTGETVLLETTDARAADKAFVSNGGSVVVDGVTGETAAYVQWVMDGSYPEPHRSPGFTEAVEQAEARAQVALLPAERSEMTDAPSINSRFTVSLRKPDGTYASREQSDDPAAAMRAFANLTGADFGKEFGAGAYAALTDRDNKLDVSWLAEGQSTYRFQSTTEEGKAAFEAARASAVKRSLESEAVIAQRLPEADSRGGRLAERLHREGIMSTGDALVTEARRALLVAPDATREIERQALAEVSDQHLRFALPAEWTGEVQTAGMVEVDGKVVEADQVGREAAFYGVYARTQDKDGVLTYEWLIDFGTAEQAQDMARRLALIDAYSQPTQQEREKRLAQLTERDLEDDPLTQIPDTWTGKFEVLRLVTVDGEPASADDLGVAPEYYGVYVELVQDGQQGWAWLHSLSDEHAAAAFGSRIEQLAASRGVDGTLAEPLKPNTSTEKTYINVPFKEKDAAKQLNAKWDRNYGEKGSWYVPAGVDLAPFAKWMPQPDAQAATASDAATVAMTPAGASEAAKTPENGPLGHLAQPDDKQGHIATQKTWLAIPYPQRDAAKNVAGTLPDGSRAIAWDKTEQSWYAKPGADLSKLKMWLPDNAKAAQGPAKSPQEEFAEALEAMGCIVEGEHPKMDGVRHRIRVQGDKGTNDKIGSGTYIAHLPEPGAKMPNGAPEIPAGYIKNHRTQIEMKWKAKGYTFTDEEKAQMHAAAAAKKQQQEAQQNAIYEGTAARVSAQLSHLIPVEKQTPYMAKKGIQPQQGAFTDADGLKLYVPAYDTKGKHWTTQYVNSDGSAKRFAKDSRKDGSFHVVGGAGPQSLAEAPAIVIGEGYATMATVTPPLGFPTVVAFDSGNLKAVATALHEKYPDKPIVILGDDDTHLVNHPQVQRNTGRVKGEEAAKAVGGTAIFPIFAPGEQQGDPAGFTDFNDLGNKSVLGIEGVERQVKGYVDDVIAKHVAVKQQHQEHQLAQAQEETRARSVRM